MTRQAHGRNCEMCDNPVSAGDFNTIPKLMTMCWDGRMRRAVMHKACCAVNAEVTGAARELARKVLTGSKGDPLPNLMSTPACEWINANQLSFQQMVGHYATLRRLYA